MAAHLRDEGDVFNAPRVRLSGPNYRGQHRSAVCQQVGQPGTFVLEPHSQVPSSVIGQIDAVTALVRHVGTCDDHAVPLADLQPFAPGNGVRLGADFGDSW